MFDTVAPAGLAKHPRVDQTTKLDGALNRAQDALLALQHADGYWCFELEADCTIPSEYIVMMHYMGEIDTELQAKIAAYVRERQTADGGWPLYHGGGFDLSCSVRPTTP